MSAQTVHLSKSSSPSPACPALAGQPATALSNMPLKRKRIRHKIPTFKKIYSAYVYDQPKYNNIFKKVQQLALKYDEEIFERTERYRVLNLCYVRDKEGKRQSAGDQKHIFRMKVLQEVLREIVDYLVIAYELFPSGDVLTYLFKRTHIIVYPYKDCRQAELLEAIDKPLPVRLKVGIALLRNLQKGLEIEDAVNIVKKEFSL